MKLLNYMVVIILVVIGSFFLVIGSPIPGAITLLAALILGIAMVLKKR